MLWVTYRQIQLQTARGDHCMKLESSNWKAFSQWLSNFCLFVGFVCLVCLFYRWHLSVLLCNRLASEKSGNPKKRTVYSYSSAAKEHNFVDTSPLSFSFLCTNTTSDGKGQASMYLCFHTAHLALIFPSLTHVTQNANNVQQSEQGGQEKSLRWWWGKAAMRALHCCGTAGSKSIWEERGMSAQGTKETRVKHRDNSKALRLPQSRCLSANQKPRTASLRPDSCSPLPPDPEINGSPWCPAPGKAKTLAYFLHRGTVMSSISAKWSRRWVQPVLVTTVVAEQT